MWHIAFIRLKLKHGLPGSIKLTNVLADSSQVFSGLEQSVILKLLQVKTRRNSKVTQSSDSSPKKNPVFKAEFKTKNPRQETQSRSCAVHHKQKKKFHTVLHVEFYSYGSERRWYVLLLRVTQRLLIF